VEEALYRVALETLNNVLKHARASSVKLHLLFEEGAVRINIRDDGAGFDLGSASRYGGYGLAIMKERVQHIGGELSIETAPGAGTSLCVEVAA
jgi:signal transduction histidine kinase